MAYSRMNRVGSMPQLNEQGRMNRRMQRGFDHWQCKMCGTEFVYGEVWVFGVRTLSLLRETNLLNVQCLHEHVRANTD